MLNQKEGSIPVNMELNQKEGSILVNMEYFMVWKWPKKWYDINSQSFGLQICRYGFLCASPKNPQKQNKKKKKKKKNKKKKNKTLQNKDRFSLSPFSLTCPFLQLPSLSFKREQVCLLAMCSLLLVVISWWKDTLLCCCWWWSFCLDVVTDSSWMLCQYMYLQSGNTNSRQWWKRRKRGGRMNQKQ